MSRKRKHSPLEGMESDEASKKRVWALLQVLSGQMGVSEAAKTVQISAPRYYQLEKKALQAMLLAMSPSVGRGQPLARLERLQERSHVLEQENARQRQLLRMAKRLWGPMAETEARKGRPEAGRLEAQGAGQTQPAGSPGA